MDTEVSPREFYAAFRARLRALRKERGWTQAELADLLDVDLASYQKYEIRSAFPLHLLPKLSLLVGRDTLYLLTGVAEKRRETKGRKRAVAGSGR